MAAKTTKHSAYIPGKRPVRFPGYWLGHDADDLDNVPKPYPPPQRRATRANDGGIPVPDGWDKRKIRKGA
jgi:hypothetical protein